MDEKTYYTSARVKPIILSIARRLEKLNLGRMKKGKINAESDDAVLKLMLIYNSIDWWTQDQIKKVLLWLKVNYGI